MLPSMIQSASNRIMATRSDKDTPNELPDVDTMSEEYALGFQAGTDGKPCEGETREWQRGWADAQE
jgi:hypothetical protein